jgi:hypothetical protein
MLGSRAALLSCLTQLGSRAALHSRLTLRAPPLLAAYAPACRRGGARGAAQLHVFARRPSADHEKVEVGDGADAGDLKRAVIAALRLDAPPDSVRLLRETEGGGAPVPLDSRRGLTAQGVCEGCSVVVEMMPPPPPPMPPPLDFVEEVLGGEAMMVANLQRSPGIYAPRPFFLTLQEHSYLMDFLRQRP